MTLLDKIDNSRTDKNTVHSYISLYQKLLKRYKGRATNILEIGIGPEKHSNGGSIKLWHDYFKTATVWAADIIPYSKVYDGIKNNPRINIVLGNAYNENENTYKILSKQKYDFILDDGPHSLQSMIQCIKLYLPLIKKDGIFIIEDVQDFSWFDILRSHVDLNIYCVITYDLRKNKDRYDDLVFTVKYKI